MAGERYVYKFVCDPEALFSMAFPDNQRPVLKTDLERQINEEDTVPLSHFDENMAYLQEGGYCNPHPYNEGYVYWKLLQEQSGRFKTKQKLSDCPSFPSVIPQDKREHFMDRGWWQCVNLQTYWCSYVRCSFGVFCCYWRGWGVSACRFLTAKDSWGQMASLRTDVLNYLDRLESGAHEWKKSQTLLPLKLLDCLWSALLFSHIFTTFVFSPLVLNWVNNTVYYYENKILQTLHVKVKWAHIWNDPYTSFLAHPGPIKWLNISTVTTNDRYYTNIQVKSVYIFSYEYNVLEEGRCR